LEEELEEPKVKQEKWAEENVSWKKSWRLKNKTGEQAEENKRWKKSRRG
jgi:hypothetical protein